MKKVITLIASCILLSQFAGAQEMKGGLAWYTDLNQAWQVSQKTHKPIFAFFTGSDWCGWCHRLQANVLNKPGFQKWAKESVVLLELDFPRNKQLPDSTAQQNNSLQQAFRVQGFPTIWIFNLDKDKATNKFNISALGSLGYPQSQPGQEEVAFLENANSILKNKK